MNALQDDPQKIDRGSYGTVLGFDYAVKVIFPGSEEYAIREFVMLCACAHPQVVEVRQLVAFADCFGIVMRRHQESLSDYLTRAKVSTADAESIAKDIAAGLAHIHSRGVIHADIKPKNILVDWSDNDPRAYICDLGIAVIAEEETHHYAQTVGYRAPEMGKKQSAKKYGYAVDAWGYGCVVFELALGKKFAITTDKDPRLVACGALNIDASGLVKKITERLMAANQATVMDALRARVPPDLLGSSGVARMLRVASMCLLPHPQKRATMRDVLSHLSPGISVPLAGSRAFWKTGDTAAQKTPFSVTLGKFLESRGVPQEATPHLVECLLWTDRPELPMALKMGKPATTLGQSLFACDDWDSDDPK